MQAGFSLLELLVIIAIISILASIAFFSGDLIRKAARDAQRTEALTQLGLFMEQYKIRYGRYPRCTEGVYLEPGLPTDTSATCEDRDQLNDLASELNFTWPTDPLGPHTGTGNVCHYYFYHSNHPCDGVTAQALLFTQYEIPQNSNLEETCPVTGALDPAIASGENTAYLKAGPETICHDINRPGVTILGAPVL